MPITIYMCCDFSGFPTGDSRADRNSFSEGRLEGRRDGKRKEIGLNSRVLMIISDSVVLCVSLRGLCCCWHQSRVVRRLSMQPGLGLDANSQASSHVPLEGICFILVLLWAAFLECVSISVPIEFTLS